MNLFDGKKVITSEMLKPILEREDRIDCFIHLLSRNGAKVPISSVHWVLGLNRQMALAEKIRDPIGVQPKATTVTGTVSKDGNTYDLLLPVYTGISSAPLEPIFQKGMK